MIDISKIDNMSCYSESFIFISNFLDNGYVKSLKSLMDKVYLNKIPYFVSMLFLFDDLTSDTVTKSNPQEVFWKITNLKILKKF